MQGMIRSRWFAALCCLVLAGFGYASVAAWAGHTDDGCAVELHCFACHWVMASTADIILPVSPGPVVESAGLVLALATPSPTSTAILQSASRGPPTL
jgi:hypothetical protein